MRKSNAASIWSNALACRECHLPRNDKGEYDRSQWLQGELIDYKPTRPMPFAAIAPPIAGLPTFAKMTQR